MALKESETVDDKRRDWEHGATMKPIHFIIAVTALAYGSVATLGFVSDDHGLITHPITGIGQQTVSQIFTQDLWHFQQSQSGYYRPLMMLSLKVDHLLFGEWAGGYHLHSLAWHLACVWLINLLFGRLLGDARGALAAGIYALHPLLSEQVAFISARNDSMAIALGLAAIWQVGSRRPSRGQCIAATLFATAACLSKETGLVVLGLLPLIDWAKGRDAVGWHRYAAVATGVTTAFFVREVIGPGLTHSPPMNAAELVQDERLPLLGHMLGKLTWPWPLTDSTHLAYLGALDPLPVASTLILMALLVTMGRRWGRLGVLFALVSLLPGMLAIASRFLIADRYLGLAVLGLAIAIAGTAPRSRRALWGLLVMVPLAWPISQRVGDWKTDLSLAKSAHAAAPTPFTSAWLGHELGSVGQVDSALPYLEAATAGDTPTCDFAGEWIRLTRQANGVDAALSTANRVWDRGCASGPGVRGEWALTHLEGGDVQSARKILTPRPTTCSPTLALPVVVISLLDGGIEQAKHCARTARVPQHVLQPEVDRLLVSLTQELVPNPQPKDEAEPPSP